MVTFLYRINWLVFVTKTWRVYCVIRTEHQSIIHGKFGFQMLTTRSAELSLGTSSYPRRLYHNVKCWMNKAAARLCEWRAADATDRQDTSTSDGSYRPKISSDEQTGEITLDIRNGREQRTVKVEWNFPLEENKTDNIIYVQTQRITLSSK